MADNPNERGPQDRSRINLHQDYEVRYWANKFGVSEADLRKAVEAVGSSAEKVAERLGKAA